MTVCFNLLRYSCLVSAFLICVCVCVCGAGEVGVHVHMLLQERQFISLIKSSIFNVNLREICLCIQCAVGSECGIQRKTLAQQ